MGGGWAARLVLCIPAAACLCTVCAAKDPVTLHRIVTSSQGCGPDRANSAEQCKQFAAAGVQCPGNVSNGTSMYQGDTKQGFWLRVQRQRCIIFQQRFGRNVWPVTSVYLHARHVFQHHHQHHHSMHDERRHDAAPEHHQQHDSRYDPLILLTC